MILNPDLSAFKVFLGLTSSGDKEENR